MLSTEVSSSVRSFPVARRATRPAARRGSARKNTNTAMPTAAGSALSSGLLGPGKIPMYSAKPVTASVITLTALVRKNSTAERSATRAGGPPRSISIQAPTVTLPTPPNDTAAPNASSVSATRAPRRIGTRSNTCRNAIT
jgi:hypothetical protein